MRNADKTLILFANTMWGLPLEFEGLNLPEGCELTADKTRFRNATAVVFHVPSMTKIDHIPKLTGQTWVAWSMECDVNYPQLSDPEFMKRFDVTMTYHRHSDVPVPYYGPNLIHELRTPPKPKTKDKLVALFLSSPLDRSGRMPYILELMECVDVHSYGRVLKNIDLKEDAGRDAKLATIADYKFAVAFENAIGPDYVTEKFFDPLVAGSVPIYLGAPNIDAFAPAGNCFIDAASFSTPKDLAEYLLLLDNDDAAYGEHLAWKKEPVRADFVAMADEVGEHAFVRLCRKVQDMCEQ